MNNIELTEEEIKMLKMADDCIKAAAEAARLKEQKERLAKERRVRELRNIREAEETERAIEEWRFSKYQD